MIDQDEANKTSALIAYGWAGGKARAFTALRPYVRHLEGCAVPADAVPDNGFCTCGLRSAWRIRETTEDQT